MSKKKKVAIISALAAAGVGIFAFSYGWKVLIDERPLIPWKNKLAGITLVNRDNGVITQ